MENMTELSRERFEWAVRIRDTREAARVLRDAQGFRTLGDVLRSFSGNQEPKVQLVEGLMKWNPGDKRDSVDKKVRNWLRGATQSIDKEEAFVLSRVLGLSLEKANEFLKRTTGEGIHWRDPRDIVWCYAIVHELEPEAVKRLQEKVEALWTRTPGYDPNASRGQTALVFDRLQPVLYGSEEELLEFLKDQSAELGTFHNTAHRMFMRFMALLEEGFSDEDVEKQFEILTQRERKKKEEEASDRRETARKEGLLPEPGAPVTLQQLDGDTELYQPDRITTREILETYLYRNLVPAKEKRGAGKQDPFAAVRRSIRQSWPDEFTLSRMKGRQTEVTRKVLILLFLATDGSSTDYAEMDEDEELYTQEDIFLDIYTRLDLMLSACGFLKLDPRSPFDWMILYCISAGDLWESDERLQSMLLEMFPEE